MKNTGVSVYMYWIIAGSVAGFLMLVNLIPFIWCWIKKSKYRSSKCIILEHLGCNVAWIVAAWFIYAYVKGQYSSRDVDYFVLAIFGIGPLYMLIIEAMYHLSLANDNKLTDIGKIRSMSIKKPKYKNCVYKNVKEANIVNLGIHADKDTDFISYLKNNPPVIKLAYGDDMRYVEYGSWETIETEEINIDAKLYIIKPKYVFELTDEMKQRIEHLKELMTADKPQNTPLRSTFYNHGVGRFIVNGNNSNYYKFMNSKFGEIVRALLIIPGLRPILDNTYFALAKVYRPRIVRRISHVNNLQNPAQKGINNGPHLDSDYLTSKGSLNFVPQPQTYNQPYPQPQYPQPNYYAPPQGYPQQNYSPQPLNYYPPAQNNQDPPEESYPNPYQNDINEV